MSRLSYVMYDPKFDDVYEYAHHGWVDGWMATNDWCVFYALNIPKRFVLIGEL